MLTNFEHINYILRNSYNWEKRWGKWNMNYPDIQRGTITPQQYCINLMKQSFNETEAQQVFNKCIEQDCYYNMITSIIEYIIDHYHITFNKKLFMKYISSSNRRKWTQHTETTNIFYNNSYIPTKEDLLFNDGDDTMLYKLMNVLHGDIGIWFNPILANDKTITLEYILSEKFVCQFDFSMMKHTKCMKYLITKLCTESLQPVRLLQFVTKGIPYYCFRDIVQMSDIGTTDLADMIEYLIIREKYIENDRDVIIDNIEMILTHPTLANTVIEWLCKNFQAGQLNIIKMLHKKTHVKFTQTHLDNACKHIKVGYATIKYILENCDKTEVKVSTRLLKSALYQHRPPRIYSLLIEHLE